MNKNRLEAFSDGVLAIIITIMVLEIKVPHHNSSFMSIRLLYPVFLSYVLSFIYIGIYWNNHHHMVHSLTKVNGKILWANMHLLFWLSLVPFATAWAGQNHFAPSTMALYGFILLMAGIAYFILQHLIILSQGNHSLLRKALGRDWKGKLSPMFYLLGIIASNYNEWISAAIYILVAMMWLIPDKRIERLIDKQNED